MRFAEFITVVAPVGIVGATMYLVAQRWLCDPATERGLHWRGLALKIACWPVFLAGTLLAIVRADVPYIPTAKEAVRGRFVRLAWPQLAADRAVSRDARASARRARVRRRARARSSSAPRRCGA